MQKRGKKGKIWIKFPRYRVELDKMEMALAREQKREKNGAKTRENGAKEREEKKKKGVMY